MGLFMAISFSPDAQSYLSFQSFRTAISVIHVFENKNSQEEALRLILKIKLIVIEILIKYQKAINKQQNKSCFSIDKKLVGQNVRQVVKLIEHLYFLDGQCLMVKSSPEVILELQVGTGNMSKFLNIYYMYILTVIIDKIVGTKIQHIMMCSKYCFF